MSAMTGSYSEIFDTNDTCEGCVDRKFSDPIRPVSLDLFDSHQSDQLKFHKAFGALHLQGEVSEETDGMITFVAEDLETKIKMSSPPEGNKATDLQATGSSKCLTNLYRQALTPHVPTVDPHIINDLEIEARNVATSVDNLIENLAGILHSMSALTVDCLETYRDSVCKTCDSVDSNIKAMYQLMAKTEELSKTMKPIYAIAEDIKKIKKLVDILENVV